LSIKGAVQNAAQISDLCRDELIAQITNLCYLGLRVGLKLKFGFNNYLNILHYGQPQA